MIEAYVIQHGLFNKRKGSQRKKHKYIKRETKNGKYVYTYPEDEETDEEVSEDSTISGQKPRGRKKNVTGAGYLGTNPQVKISSSKTSKDGKNRYSSEYRSSNMNGIVHETKTESATTTTKKGKKFNLAVTSTTDTSAAKKKMTNTGVLQGEKATAIKSKSKIVDSSGKTLAKTTTVAVGTNNVSAGGIKTSASKTITIANHAVTATINKNNGKFASAKLSRVYVAPQTSAGKNVADKYVGNAASNYKLWRIKNQKKVS